MTKGKILVFSFHFYPSSEVGAKRPSETAQRLLQNGYDVTVLSARDKRFDGIEVPEALRQAEIATVRIPRRLITAAWIGLKSVVRRLRRRTDPSAPQSPGGGGEKQTQKMTLFAWLRRQLLAFDTLFQGNKRWLFRSVLKLMFKTRGRRIDLVIASGPPMVSYIGGWLIARLKGCKLILDYRDPWYLHGDKELTTVMLGHPLANFENRLADRCARDCDALIAASPGTKRHILESFDVPPERVHVVRNGFDPAAVVDRAPPHGRLALLYAGSLYWNRNPFPFLEALEVLLRDPRVDRGLVRCRLAGNCDEWKGVSLHAWIAERDLGDVVEILPFMSAKDLNALVGESNVLINFAQGQPRQIPAKSYECIASRRDILVITENDSDVADLFREAGVGFIVEPGDTAGFADALQALYLKYVDDQAGSLQAQADIEAYSRAAQLEQFLRIVEGVMAAPDQLQKG